MQRPSRGLVMLAPELWYRLHHVVREGVKFLAVGGAGYIVDVGLFNLLRYAGGEGPLYDKPLTAKIIATVVATFVTYAGNRFWTFRHRRRTGYLREYVLFFVLNAIGLGIAVGCLAFSHYVLDLRSPLADNISANVVGLGLGTMWRFWSYRRWVFPTLHLTEGPEEVAAADAVAGPAAPSVVPAPAASDARTPAVAAPRAPARPSTAVSRTAVRPVVRWRRSRDRARADRAA